MAKTISQLLPDPELLLSLEPEDLAGVVLDYLNSLSDEESGQLNRYNFSLPHTVAGYPPERYKEIGRALMEAWVWLEREGLLAPQPGSPGDWVFITRRGKQMKSASDLKAYRNAGLLPRQLLHPIVAGKVIGAFVRGEYDTAVFQAFKEVEVAVRAKGKFPDTEVGVPLMRRAFDPKPAHCVTPAWLKRSVRRPRIYLPARWGRSRTRTAIGMCPSPIRRKPLNCSSSPATSCGS